MTFKEVGENADLDFEARKQLEKLRKMGSAMAKEPKYLLDRFVLEPTDPMAVGINEMYQDQFSPEELVQMLSRPPHVIDWDMLEVA